ncbi:ATP-dependent DNA ligase [Burkholderia sp. L27(2015)]|uniref:ATP-dependent DNA ligase n=1 Tax=Burkholderia sp. L27(2015) TaxID=1641858 RepID=UPI00131B2A73|nr:ATP-dependent DNA ligase [Burkholderia sp. L27(2015)]
MKRFAALYNALDATTSTSAKLAALVDYFRAAPARDAAWAVYFLAGGKPRQSVPTRVLRTLAAERAGLSEWLFDEAYQAVGDLAETIAHVMPDALHTSDLGLADWIETRVLILRGLSPEALRIRLGEYWDQLDWGGRFLLTKLIGGGFRVGVSRQLVTRALAEIAGIDHKKIAQRMVGWTDARHMPDAARYLQLVAALDPNVSHLDHDPGLPYPFFLAQPWQQSPDTLGDPANWIAEWKWDGIRGQIVKREGQVWLWSRGEDLLTERFPEIAAMAALLPDGTVLDGEIIAWRAGDDKPLPFAAMQPRITRKTVTRKILDDAPAIFIAYDLLEYEGIDLREQTQCERRARLAELLTQLLTESPGGLLPTSPDIALRISHELPFDNWSALETLQRSSRARGVEGLMLKERSARYGTGRTRSSGLWLKWKVDPYTADAVLIYAQRGHGRRASLYTDFTFAVWDRNPAAPDGQAVLVPFAKAYSGLTDAEMREVDAFVRKTTVEKFGPVRSVTPELVFEIGFEGIQLSPRHKSGIAVRFPRILRWRRDKPASEADTLETLQGLLSEPAES